MQADTRISQRYRSPLCLLLALLCMLWFSPASAGDQRPGKGFTPVQKLLDLSGLAWIGGDTFLTVHDAKYPDEDKRTRVSLIRLPKSLDGLQWKPLRLRFMERKSSDLESAARIPGTRDVLLVESGDDGSDYNRIYLARANQRSVRIVDDTEWPTFYSVFNVEATAVARTNHGFLFIWAERAQGKSSTQIHWTDMRLKPFQIGRSGKVGEVTFELPPELSDLYNRPLVGLDLAPDGVIYGVAAQDSDFDNGPWRSAIMRIGKLDGTAIELDDEPTLVGKVDGFKLESVAIRPGDDGLELFFGTDDENYGGTLRQMFLDRD